MLCRQSRFLEKLIPLALLIELDLFLNTFIAVFFICENFCIKFNSDSNLQDKCQKCIKTIILGDYGDSADQKILDNWREVSREWETANDFSLQYQINWFKRNRNLMNDCIQRPCITALCTAHNIASALIETSSLLKNFAVAGNRFFSLIFFFL